MITNQGKRRIFFFSILFFICETGEPKAPQGPPKDLPDTPKSPPGTFPGPSQAPKTASKLTKFVSKSSNLAPDEIL